MRRNSSNNLHILCVTGQLVRKHGQTTDHYFKGDVCFDSLVFHGQFTKAKVNFLEGNTSGFNCVILKYNNRFKCMCRLSYSTFKLNLLKIQP